MSQTLREQLVREIRDCGLTAYRVAVLSRVDTGALSKFLAGKRGLSLDAVDRIVEALDLELRQRRKQRKQR